MYWVRRHLKFEAREWRALPWWESRLYLEGLNAEFAAREEAITEDGEPVQMVPAESVGIHWS